MDLVSVAVTLSNVKSTTDAETGELILEKDSHKDGSFLAIDLDGGITSLPGIGI